MSAKMVIIEKNQLEYCVEELDIDKLYRILVAAYPELGLFIHYSKALQEYSIRSALDGNDIVSVSVDNSVLDFDPDLLKVESITKNLIISCIN